MQHLKPALIYTLTAALIIIITLTIHHQATIIHTQAAELERAQHLQQVEAERQAVQAELEAERQAREQAEQEREQLQEMLINRARTYEIFAAAPVERPLSRGREVTPTAAPVTLPSGFTADNYERAWEILNLPGMAGTGEALAQAEKKYGVNGLVIAGIAYLESGGGTSKIARDKNNLCGLGAYDHDPYGCAFAFDDKADSIFALAELLADKYLSSGGKYNNGNSLEGINVRYATDGRWAEKVAGRMKQICCAAVDNPGKLLAAAGGLTA